MTKINKPYLIGHFLRKSPPTITWMENLKQYKYHSMYDTEFNILFSGVEITKEELLILKLRYSNILIDEFNTFIRIHTYDFPYREILHNLRIVDNND